NPKMKNKKQYKLYEKINYIFENTVSHQKKMELKAQYLTNKDVKSSKAWLILSSNYDVSQNPNLAINFLKNAVWVNPKCITAYYKLGYIYENNLDKYDAAIYYYKKAVLLNPEDDVYEGRQTNARYIQLACRQLANLMYKNKNYKAVMLLLEKAIPYSETAGYPSHELIRDLIHLAVKSSVKLKIKGKFLNKLYNKYNIEADILSTISFA
ncbi:MAG: tetratricopeptide repeat protein, partial [Spirochaetota bacterium]